MDTVALIGAAIVLGFAIGRLRSLKGFRRKSHG